MLGVLTIKKGRCMLTPEVVVIFEDNVKVERANSINNKVMLDVGSEDDDDDDDGKETTS